MKALGEAGERALIDLRTWEVVLKQWVKIWKIWMVDHEENLADSYIESAFNQYLLRERQPWC